MDYEKKIKNALNDKSIPFEVQAWLEEQFPELAESKDEMIRKEILEYFQQFKNEGLRGINISDWIAWLEKQGEQKSIDELTQQEAMDIAVAKCFEQGEQKPADKPKFHEGEWITNGDYTLKIVEIKPLYYILKSQDGNIVDDTISHADEQFRLWTIKDAKPGDVLIDKFGSRECPFIFKETKPSDIKTDVPNPLTVFGYCGIGGAGFTKSSGWGDTANCIYYPATKNQRDTLEGAIINAGYEWDAEKKELRKLSHSKVTKISDQVQKPVENRQETKPNGGIVYEDFNEGDGSYKVNLAYLSKPQVELIENLVISWQNPANNSVKWSEEDIRNIENIDSVLFYDKDLPEDTCVRLRNWLKSLKQRIGG